jgi:hypothetical protein
VIPHGGIAVIGNSGARLENSRALFLSFLHRHSGFDPVLLAFGIIFYVPVSHGRQFTGGVLGGVSSELGAIDDDFSILVGQHAGGKLAHFIGRQVKRAGQMALIVSIQAPGSRPGKSILCCRFSFSTHHG